MDPLPEIEALVAFEGRAPGSDAERRAAGHLADRLEALGRTAEIEPIQVRPRYELVHLVHERLDLILVLAEPIQVKAV